MKKQLVPYLEYKKEKLHVCIFELEITMNKLYNLTDNEIKIIEGNR